MNVEEHEALQQRQNEKNSKRRVGESEKDKKAHELMSKFLSDMTELRLPCTIFLNEFYKGSIYDDRVTVQYNNLMDLTQSREAPTEKDWKNILCMKESIWYDAAMSASDIKYQEKINSLSNDDKEKAVKKLNWIFQSCLFFQEEFRKWAKGHWENL